MQTIVFIMPSFSLAVDGSNGGAIEQLMCNLIEVNEQQKCFNFVFITPASVLQSYKQTQIYKIRPRNFMDELKRIFYFPLKKLKIVKSYTTSYYSKAFKVTKQLKPDKIVIEGNYPNNIKAFSDYFGKENLYLHVHHQILDKTDISKYFGTLISVSKFIEQDWKNSNKISSKLNYETLFNCLSNDTFFNKISNSEKIELRKKLGFNNDDFVLLYVGRLIKEKGIDILINAINRIENPKIKLLIVGESVFKNSKQTPFTKNLQTLCSDIPDRVIFTGFIPNTELHKYYRIADVHIVPSVYEEAAGLVAQEGKVVGLRQIITNSGGLKEYASKNAVVVDRKNLEDNLVKSINFLYTHRTDVNTDNEPPYTKEYYYQTFKNIMEK